MRILGRYSGTNAIADLIPLLPDVPDADLDRLGRDTTPTGWRIP
jgi:hypothetical protein